MAVTESELEQRLERVRSVVSDPRAGLHGPGSQSWRVNRESVLFLGGGRAALLQLAHPAVAYAVDHHSATRVDPIGRFNRTFRNVYAMTFGDLDSAIAAARQVYRVHTRVHGPIEEDVGRFRRGDRYRANDEHALMWVHTTLVDTSLQVYELIFGVLSEQEREQYYQESKTFAWLFGIPDHVLPESWDAFARYRDHMFESGELEVSKPGGDIGTFLMTPPNRAAAPFSYWYRIITAGLLPPQLRSQFGLRFGSTEGSVFSASVAALRATYPWLPRRLRDLPPYVEAQRRLAGREEADRFGRTVERLVLRGLQPASSPAAG